MVETGIREDVAQGRKAAALLHHCFVTEGVHGQTQMPEDLVPQGITVGSLEHLLFTTLTVAIDYQRDALALWKASRESFADPATRYLYSPQLLYEAGWEKTVEDMHRRGLSKKPNRDAHIWRSIGVTFHKKWGGDPRLFLMSCNWDATTILQRLQTDTHPQNGRLVADFPNLRGAKIGPLWIRMLRDNVGITELKGLDRVPIPVDIHIARATLCLGVVKGHYRGALADLFAHVRTAWANSVKDLQVRDRAMIALDVDEPLWNLSKYGCTQRDGRQGLCPVFDQCPAKGLCTPGWVKTGKLGLELDT